MAIVGMAAATALTSAERTTRAMGKGGGPLAYLWGDDCPRFEGVDAPPGCRPTTPSATSQSTAEPDSGTGNP